MSYAGQFQPDCCCDVDQPVTLPSVSRTIRVIEATNTFAVLMSPAYVDERNLAINIHVSTDPWTNQYKRMLLFNINGDGKTYERSASSITDGTLVKIILAESNIPEGGHPIYSAHTSFREIKEVQLSWMNFPGEDITYISTGEPAPLGQFIPAYPSYRYTYVGSFTQFKLPRAINTHIIWYRQRYNNQVKKIRFDISGLLDDPSHVLWEWSKLNGSTYWILNPEEIIDGWFVNPFFYTATTLQPEINSGGYCAFCVPFLYGPIESTIKYALFLDSRPFLSDVSVLEVRCSNPRAIVITGCGTTFQSGSYCGDFYRQVTLLLAGYNRKVNPDKTVLYRDFDLPILGHADLEFSVTQRNSEDPGVHCVNADLSLTEFDE